MAVSAFEIVLAEVAYGLKPVVDATVPQPPGDGVKRLALEVGVDLEALLGPADAARFAEAVSAAHESLLAIVTDPAGFADRIPEALDALAGLVDTFAILDDLLPAGSDLVGRLFNYLLARYLEERAPLLFALLVLGGVIRAIEVPESGTIPAYRRREVEWRQFAELLRPEKAFADLYGWGTTNLDSNTLLRRLSDVLWALGLPATYSGDRAPGTSGAMDVGWMLQAGPVSSLLGVRSTQAPADGARPPGIAITPAGLVAVRHELALSRNWTLSFAVDAAASAGYRVTIRPGDVSIGPAPGQPAVSWTFDGRIGLARGAATGERTVLFGAPAGARLEARSVGVAARALAQPQGGEAGLELAVEGGRVVVALDGADGFLRRVLPPEGFAAEFDLTVGWSSAHGLYFSGSGGLETTLGVQLELGPVRVEAIQLGLRALADSRVQATASASAAIDLSVLRASVDRVGLQARIDPRPPFALDVAFKPPTGAALSIGAGTVKGGGFLTFDPDEGQYAGGIHLEFEGITLNAIGLLTTHMPDGSQGFSLLVIITASGFTPIQLGFGFTLNGVGGLLGINRTVAVDVLREGVRTRALDAILFSHDDPIPRAPQIISTLRSVFPPAPGRYVFGPMAVLGWGSPTIVTLELGLVLELFSPLRLIVMGRLRAVLPPGDEKKALVRLKLDVLGVVDFDRREASVDATLYDSSIAGFAVAGDMALRLSWGERPAFALAVGGFHPRYQPPPGFPALRRMSIALSSGDNPRVRLEAYLAVTSNTVQLGARLDLFVEALGFTLSGMLSFDALVQFAPFALDLEVAGSLALKRGGATLMGLDLRLHLTGPAPWHVTGEATFQILFFKVTIRVEATFGAAQAVSAPERVAIWPRLVAALGDASNWGTELPAGGPAAVTLRAIEAAPGELLVHPLGGIAVRQRVVPLDRRIDRFANAAPADYRRFTIASVAVGSAGRTHEPTFDSFAPAAFADMSDDEKLRAPGFDRMPAGARVQGAGAAAGPERPVTIEFETIVLEPEGEPPAKPLPATYTPVPATVARLAATGAAGTAAAQRAGRTRYAVDGDPAVAVAGPEYALVSRTGLAAPVGGAATDGSYSSAREALDAYVRARPERRGEVQVAHREEVFA
jgi:hypothetical protein